jgi:hypothetical protein
MVRMKRTALLLLCLCAPTVVGAVEPLAPPSGDTILTVAGAVGVTNADGAARFDMEMLRALPAVEFSTATIWTDGARRYVGTPLKALLDRVGAHGSTVRATALNAYAITIPLDEITDDAPIIAYLEDGAPMSVRNRGPLWILYPFDDDPRWRTEVVYSRSIWQLERLDVLD